MRRLHLCGLLGLPIAWCAWPVTSVDAEAGAGRVRPVVTMTRYDLDTSGGLEAQPLVPERSIPGDSSALPSPGATGFWSVFSTGLTIFNELDGEPTIATVTSRSCTVLGPPPPPPLGLASISRGCTVWNVVVDPPVVLTEVASRSYTVRNNPVPSLTPCQAISRAFTVRVLGDVDGDGDVDLEDFKYFAECMTGPEAGFLEAGCRILDGDLDVDVDLDDFAGFQEVFTGPLQ